MRKGNRVLSSAFLLGTTFLIHPAVAADNSVGTQSLTATNSGDVNANANLGQSQSITSGVGNSIGASATGAVGTASVSQTVLDSTVQTGASNSPGNEVIVHGFVAGTNFGNVKAIVTITGTAGIGGGQANSIGASAVGASGNASIAQTFANGVNLDLTSLDPNHVRVTDGVAALNIFGAVDARLDAGASTISDGIGNSISAQAIGSQANASITSRAFDTTTNATAVGPAQTNKLQVGDAFLGLSLFSLNLGDVSSKATLGTMTVTNGIGNSIGASAFGASAGAGINQAASFTTSGNIDLTTLFDNNVQVDGAIVSLNGGDVTARLNSPTARSSALISNGIGNSIAAQAVGASAGASISQQFDNVTDTTALITNNGNKSRNTVDTGALFAGNGGDVTARADFTSGKINDGVGNFLGASAVGASAGAGITQAISTSTINPGTALGRNQVTVDGIDAQNGSGPNGPFGHIDDTVRATVTFNQNASVTQGVSNSVGASALGASAGANVNQQLLGGSADLTELANNSVLVDASGPGNRAISAVNTGHSDVHATVTMTVGQLVAEANSGIGNSVSATAGGASASATIASLMEQTTTASPTGNAQKNVVDTTGGSNTAVHASNNGVITAKFDAAPAGLDSVAALVGISNSVGATAFGASASAGVNQSIYLSSGVNLTSLFNNDVTTGNITARNHAAGDVTATLDVSGNVTVGNATVAGPISDSVAAQAVGAAATASISSNFFRLGTSNGTLPTTDKNHVVTGDIRATNRADITAQASLESGNGNNLSSTIVNGVNGFIGASAGGASAGASVSQLLDSSSPNLLNLPGNTVQSGDVTANNSGVVTASLTDPASATIVSNTAIPATTIGNSIAAQANGASASASITSAFNTVAAQTTSGTPSANSVTVASLDSTNSGAVSAHATFGTANTATLASIGGGVGNSIGAIASGASSIASINQVVDGGVWGGPTPGARLGTLPTNSVSVGSITAMNSAPVSAHLTTLGTTPSTIAGGIGNSITASAVGASAGASIAQTLSAIH